MDYLNRNAFRVIWHLLDSLHELCLLWHVQIHSRNVVKVLCAVENEMN